MTTAELLRYCASPYARRRRQTRVVMVGDVAVGGDNPIRVQSMTTTRTLDTEATVAEAIRLVEVGCEIVRITAPTVNDARNLGRIRAELRRRGVVVPLVADIHFSPAAALEAALHVEKVRINPGNYADSKTFAVKEYSDEEYQAELARIEERFRPVVLRCKQLGRALRIGTNHGSLSDRIMNRFGDTPEGMVESALEFLAICERHEFHDVIFSMKSSNPKVMVQAYRMLAARLDALGKPYPLHLGVTEAGDGEDGRIKSAVGIGSLLEDGIGDTIRVSLTEDPEAEIPVAFAIAARYAEPGDDPPTWRQPPFDPFQYARRATEAVHVGPERIGADEPPRVVATIPGPLAADVSPLTIARRLLVPVNKRHPRPDLLGVWIEGAADLAALRDLRAGLERSGLEAPILARLRPSDPDRLPELVAGVAPHADALGVPTWGTSAALSGTDASLAAPALLIEQEVGEAGPEAAASDLAAAVGLASAAGRATVAALRATTTGALIHGSRHLAARLPAGVPILLVAPDGGLDLLLDAAIGLGSPLCDGIGDAVEVPTEGDPLPAMRLAFNVLQAAGARVSKTDYVACPSCGRTLFDLQDTTARIKARTDHLVGVKIAIMGCVVNGPGEMADADFGYVGGAPGQVNLYVGKQCVERGVPEAEADERLIDLIRSRGRWADPE
jgi:(E)-4-hydroxy-3-methylbut-2-enyl-diphosphate synthase